MKNLIIFLLLFVFNESLLVGESKEKKLSENTSQKTHDASPLLVAPVLNYTCALQGSKVIKCDEKNVTDGLDQNPQDPKPENPVPEHTRPTY